MELKDKKYIKNTGSLPGFSGGKFNTDKIGGILGSAMNAGVGLYNSF
jgi:hypothetical protein